MAIVESVEAWLMQRPALLREFSLAMGTRPVISVGSTLLVLGHEQVTDVLSRERDFHLADTMRERIMSGPFLLSTEPPGEQYLTDKSILCEGVYADEGLAVQMAQAARSRAEFIVESAHGSLDVVGELLEPVAALIVQRFLIGPDDADEPDPKLLPALRLLAELIVTASPGNRTLRREVEQATRFVSGLVARRLASVGPESNDATARMHHAGVPADCIVRLITGLAGTATATIARAGGQAVDELLNRPEQVRRVACFAARGDDAAVLQFVLEALRFNPMFAFTPRTAVRETVVATPGGPVRVEPGQHLMVGLLPAMFDSSAFPEPRRFLVNRPTERYLHFGYGYHRCFGGPIAEMQFREVLLPLFRVEGLRRDPRRHGGQLRYRWPALRNLHVRWNP